MPNRVFDFYQLEDRILLSADGFHQGEGDASGDLAYFDHLLEGFSFDVDETVPTPTGELTETDQPIIVDEGHNDLIADGQASYDETSATALEVVIIDAGVENADELLAGLRDQSGQDTQWVVVRLSADSDGIDQITQSLTDLRGVDAIHILSHGDGSGIQLGNSRLDSQSIQGYAGELVQWRNALDVDADMLVYGCDLASTDQGRLLVDSIAALCQCDIAASDDATGHASLGGDWDLEYIVGDIQTEVVVGVSAQSNWYDTLATITVTTFADELDGTTTDISSLNATPGGTGISLREAIIAANNTAGADTIILGEGTYVLDITGQYDNAGSTGDLDITSDITIVGLGATGTTIDASSLSDRIFHVQGGGILDISSLTLTGASSGTETGAGIYVEGTLSASDLVVANNTVGNTTGGGISSSGTTTLERVAIINNNSSTSGAGLYVSAGTTTLNNVTVSGNQATYDGAGIYAVNGGTVVNITHSTIAANDSASGNGGGLNSPDATINVSYSIFGDNTSQFGGNDVNATIVSGGYNIIEHNLGFSGTVGSDTLGSDAGLSALSAYEETFLHTFTPTSIAYNAATGSAETVDQTGGSRDANVDIGAYEYVPGPEDLQTTSTTGGGLLINSDGGNDTYLIADDGAAIFGGRTAFTFETQFSTTDLVNDTTLLSYATPSHFNELLLIFDGGGVSIHIGDVSRHLSAVDYDLYRDGNQHQFSWTWDNTAGNWAIYVDGDLIESGTGLQTGYTLGSGSLVFGQEQDSVGGSFLQTQIFKGTLHNTRVFSDVRTATEIKASYASDLPSNESGMVAQWKFDNLSVDGVVTESVSGNNLTLQHVAGFTASVADLTFTVAEDAVDGTVVGSVGGIDPQRDSLIATLLAADPDLVYSAETGKFYKAITTNTDWATAETNAMAATLNGVGGQLATVQNAAEQEVLFGIASSVSKELFLGGTDATSEGAWRWRQNGTNSDFFWSGGTNGTPVDGAYQNWISGSQPDDSGGVQDYLVIRPNGQWDDEANDGGSDNGYIIEWDADTVLDVAQPLTYTLLSQTVAGAFAINSDSGQITVADGTLLDFETNSSQTLSIRVTDIDGNSRTESFNVSLTDVAESSNGPTDLSGGTELNIDGGNDAYFIAADGGSIFGGLTEFTFESTFSIQDQNTSPTLLSYYSGNDTVNLGFNATDNLVLQVNGASVTTANTYSGVLNGDAHHLAISWDNTNGDVQLYIDGQYAETLTGLQAGYTIAGGGELVIGNDQDGVNSGYSTDQAFHGTFYDVRLWNDIRTEAEISLNYQQKLDLSPAEASTIGLLANWQMELNGSNQIIDIVSEGTTNNRLSVGHASGGGFSTSTPTTGLHIAEDSVNGATVGYVTPSQPDTDSDVIADGLFLESLPSGDQFGVTGSFGDWTVTSGSVDVFASSSWQSLNGGRLVNLDGGSPGSIEQTLTTSVGQQYQVIFSLTGDFSGGDAVKDLRVSADGQIQDYTVAQSSNWSWGETNALETRSFTFTADSTSTDLAFASLEDPSSQYGPYIGDIRVIAIPNAVTAILNADSTLRYDASTDKFYRYVTTPTQASAAIANAVAAEVNGVSGRLVTIRSAYENHLIHEMVTSDIWIGASDQTTEGDWRWLDGSADGDAFWSGNGSGSNVDGRYYNWEGGEPNDQSGEDYAELHYSTGRWNDLPDNGSYNQHYVIEWDASEVLSGYSFTLTDDAGGRFAIDSGSGQITVADATLLDYETTPSHSITVQVADAYGNTYDETFSITVDDGVDARFTIPIGQSVDEDNSLTFSSGGGNAIVLEDGSTQNPTVTTTLSVNQGNLTLGSTTGLKFLSGTSNGQSTLTFSGTQSDINAALEGLQYSPTANYNGSDTLTVSTGTTSATDTNLYARYEFMDGVYTDQSGNGLDGTGNSDPAVTLDATRGDVIVLDSNDSITVSSGTASLADEVTISAWVNLDAAQQDAVFLSVGDAFYVSLDTSSPGGGISLTADSFTTNTSNPAHQIAGTGWHHIAATFDDVANEINLYLDGTLIANVSASVDIDWATAISQDLTIGSLSDGSMSFVGSLDDVRVYDAILTESEVAAVMGDQGPDTEVVNITVNAINDDPTNAGSLPSDILVTIDTTSNINLSSVDFSDVDAASGNITVTLTTSTGGQLSASSGGGVTVGGSASAMTFTGTITDLNTFFDTPTNIQYIHGTPGTTGDNADTISVTINDGGNTGSGGGGDVSLGTVNIDISPPNQAPVLFPYGPVYNTAEDAGSLTASVAMVLSSSMSDPDPGAVEGIALYGFTGSGGTLEYSLDGSNWFTVTTVSPTGALLLRDTDLFRFTPSTENGGTLQLDYRGWDQTSGTAGTYVDSSVNGGSSAFSSASDQVNVNITSVNDAPVLDSSGSMTLTSITEDDTNNAGDSIASIISSAGGDRITDVDNGAVEGIAITSLNSGNGTWQYSTNGGSTWTDVGAVANNSALLLRSTDLVRFQPDGDNGTSADFTFRAWDQTSGAAGSKVDTSTNGGTSAFSSATESAAITVTAINDDPTNAGSLPSDISVTEDQASNVDLSAINLSDVDAGASSITVTLSTSTGGQLSVSSGGGVTVGGSASAMTLTGTVSDLNTFLDTASNIQYQHATANLNGNDADQIAVVVNDNGNTGTGGGGDISLGTVNVDITAVNDEQVLSTNTGATFTEASTGNTITTAMLETTDVDNATNQLTYTVSTTPSNGTVYRNGVALSATDTFTQADIDANLITYSHDGSQTSSDAFNFTVDDGAGSNTAGTFNITISAVNDAPVTAAIEGTPLAYTENQAATAITSTLALTDVDDANLESAVVQITGNYANGQDVLSFVNQNGITGSWDAATGTLTLTGTATVADYQTALRSVAYSNTSDAPNTSQRTVSFTVNDGDVNSNTQTRAIDVTAANDAPVLDNTGSMTLTTITEDDTNNAGDSIASIISSAGGDRITDVDNGAVEGIAITSLNSGNGTWQYSTNGGSSWTDVGAVANNSALLLRSTDLVRFQPDGDNGTSADFTFRAWDQTSGAAGSKVDTSTNGGTSAFSSATESAAITVTAINDDPTNAGSLPSDISVTEDQASNVDLSAINLSDVDAGASSITVTLSTSTGGQLSASSGGGVTVGGSASAMTLTGTVSDLNTFLDTASNIQYQHTTANLNGNDADQIAVVVNDNGNTGTGGGGDISLGTVNVDITAVNDEQVLSTNTGATFTEASTGNTITTAMLETTDVDNATNQLTYTVSTTPSNGTVYRNGVALSATDTFTQADIDANLITYSHDGSQTSSDAFNFTVDDGAGSNTAGTFNITISAVNDAPVTASIEGTPLAYTENQAATAITSTLALTDVDDANLESAVVQITGNYANGQDVLSFVNQNGITGSWDSATGTLTLTGTATVADYQTALRSVAYSNTSDAPNTSQRTVSFTVNDGDVNSNTQTRAIDVTAVNDAPVLTTFAPTYNTSEDAAPLTTTVSALLGSYLSDPDAGAVEGIAVFGFSGSGGTIEYSLDGSNWVALPSVSPSSALLLRDTDFVRFIPATDNGGTLLFDYRGWDQTTGSAGSQVDATTTGGTTAFSAVSDQVTVNVASVNDEEVLSTNTGSTVAEGSTGNIITNTQLQTTDVDNTTSQLTYTVDSAPGNGTLYRNGVALSASDTFTQADIDSNLITYNHDGSQTSSDSFSFTVDDGTGTTTSSSFSWSITNVNDAPVASAIEGTALTYTENAGALQISSTLSLADVDDTQLESAVIQISGNYVNGEDTLAFTNQNGITGSWDSATGTLTLSGTATVADYQAALRSVTYSNGSDNPSALSRTVTFTINDGDVDSNSQSRNISISAVNDDPTNAGSLPSDVNVTEDVAGAIDLSAIDLNDIDANSGNLTVTLSTSTGGNLTASNGGGVVVGGSGSGSITLTGTLSDLNTYLNTPSNVQYLHATTNTFGNDADTITVTVNDGGNTGSGGGGNINLGTVNVDIAGVNDEQVLATNSTPTFGEASTGNTITNAMLETTDVDHASSQLTYSVDSAPTNGTIFRSGVALSATDTFTQADIDAGLITYDHDGSQTVSDAFSFTVDDGTGTTTSATFNITIAAVNDPPVTSSIEGASLGYTENDGAVSITSSLTLSDVDDTNLESATVQISANYVNGQDVLSFTNQNGITGSWDAATGTLTLSGTASVADYQTALRSVTYENTSEAPSTGTRTVSFTINDGELDSNTQSRSITIASINDDPGNSGGLPSDVTTIEDINSAIDLSAINLTDLDAGTSDLTVTLSTSTGGLLSASGGSGVIVTGSGSNTLTLTGNLTDLNTFLDASSNIQYLHGTPNLNGNDADTIDVVVNDNGNSGTGGGTDIQLGTVNVDITSVNDAPVATGESFDLRTPDSDLSIASSGLVFNDTDLDGDTLSVVLVSSPTNGTLTLQPGGVLLYTPNSGFGGIDTFLYRVTDGSLESNTVSVSINVQLAAPYVAPTSTTDTNDTSTDDSNTDTQSEETQTEDTTEPDNSNTEESNTESETQNSETTPTATAPGEVAGPNGPVPVVGQQNDSGDDENDASGEKKEAIERERIERLASSYRSSRTIISADGVFSPELAQLDRLLREDMQQAIIWSQWDNREQFHDKSTSSVSYVGYAGASIGMFSVGYVMWALRGGAMVGVFASALPAWRFIDPIAMLSAYRDFKDSTEDGLESLIRTRR
ncbi:DUF4347 domain-containing protein [Stieleria sp. JC731]|nr:cadherin-like domain-containing protein [Stieleria sp. JC731]MCC9598944.1 DUF4347 domain-containing protein [Stieleria sp. JC731]